MDHTMFSMVARMEVSLSSMTLRDFRVVRLGRSSRRFFGLVFAVFETGARAEPFSGTARQRFVFVLLLFIMLPALPGFHHP
jgi:hypothetical protein